MFWPVCSPADDRSTVQPSSTSAGLVSLLVWGIQQPPSSPRNPLTGLGESSQRVLHRIRKPQSPLLRFFSCCMLIAVDRCYRGKTGDSQVLVVEHRILDRWENIEDGTLASSMGMGEDMKGKRRCRILPTNNFQEIRRVNMVEWLLWFFLGRADKRPIILFL